MAFPRKPKKYAQMATANSVTTGSITNGTILNADLSASAAVSLSKLELSHDAYIIVYDGETGTDGDAIPVAVAMSGDGTISETGVFAIASGVIINDDIKSDAAIDFSKLASLDSGYLLVGSSGNVATKRAISGDVTISNTGVTSLSTPFAHTTDGLGRVEKMAVATYSYGVDYSSIEIASATDIDVDTDTITSTGHSLTAGTVIDMTTSDTLPTGISATTAYYVGEVGEDTFQLFDTYAHGVAGGATGLVNITNVGVGTQTLHINRFGVINLGITMPDNAIVTGGMIDVTTAFVDVDDGTNNTAALHLVSANDIFSAANLTAGIKDVVPDSTGSTAVKMTAAKDLFLTIGTECLKSGKAVVYLRYVEGT